MEEKSTTKESDLIRMTPAELESLIDKVIDGVENEQTPVLESKIDRLERLMIEMNSQRPALGSAGRPFTFPRLNTACERTLKEGADFPDCAPVRPVSPRPPPRMEVSR